MPIVREFINWSSPLLPAIVARLLERCPPGPCPNLSRWIAVFPGRQSGRRFLELLVEASGGAVLPPRILTVGALPELLYVPQRPFASDLTQLLAWARALRSLPPARREIVVRQPPVDDDHAGWLKLGELLRAQHTELAADGLLFADVIEQARDLPGFTETERWSVLAEAQSAYLAQLDALGLWDLQTARLVAIKQRECKTDQNIVTIGAVDMNRTTRAMLDQVAERVTAFIHAPAELATHFDAHGCLIPQQWSEETLEIRPDQIQLVDDPAGQAGAVLRTLASYQGRYALEEISVAAPDPQMARLLERTLAEWEIPAFRTQGRPLLQSPPGRLLQAIADFLDQRRCDAFSALLRHPDVGAFLDRRKFAPDWLTRWDTFVSTHLPHQIDDALPCSESGWERKLISAVENWLRPLRGGPRRLSEWTPVLREALAAIYAHRFDFENFAEARDRIDEMLQSHQEIPQELDPSLSAADAIRFTLEELSSDSLAVSDPGAAVLLSGWLDMPLDDAPAAIVTSLNEGLIPSSVNHDLFLPNALRQHLGIEDNARRYARDFHALATILHSRSRVQLIAARRNRDGDPLAPSRLLFAAAPEQIARRTLAFYRDRESAAALPTRHVPAEASAFPIPRPQPLAAPRETFRVTELRAYLNSPYRYYLSHVLGLSGMADDVEELDGLAFGNLLHETLLRFGQEESLRDSCDEAEIARALNGFLDEIAQARYGSAPLAAVRIQIEQSRSRLEAFARWQAVWRGSGWRIAYVEWSPPEPVPFPLNDDSAALLRGRIDRIDRHVETGEWALFDYKTGDKGEAPHATHRSKTGEWLDFQLPLYRHLARGAGIVENLRLGYLVLPRDSHLVAPLFADWTADELAAADEAARAVIQSIRAERFWVPQDHASRWADDFDAICQTQVFGQEVSL